MRALHFSWTKIARLLGVSRQTLYRRLEEFGISCSDSSDISPDELDATLKTIKCDHPNDGEVMVQGHLTRLGIRVPRSQVRASIHRVDHVNVEQRKSRVVKRRQYNVDSPNSIWHIDGHHKLIRWRFVVHGAIDGFSRVVPYIVCANNNRASTVLAAFQGGVSRFGLPEKVRSDHGGENVDVWKHMLEMHNSDPRSVITGSSTHNERIERLWRDVHRSIVHFADLFKLLETEGTLDPLNEIDMFCLQYVFLPRIGKCLSDFQESWNNHPVSSEGNMTPYQLFAEGMQCAIELNAPTVTGVNSIQQVELISNEPIVVPEVAFVPCTSLTLQLQQSIFPLQSTSDHGKNVYQQTIELVGHHLINNCSNCTCST